MAGTGEKGETRSPSRARSPPSEAGCYFRWIEHPIAEVPKRERV